MVFSFLLEIGGDKSLIATAVPAQEKHTYLLNFMDLSH